MFPTVIITRTTVLTCAVVSNFLLTLWLIFVVIRQARDVDGRLAKLEPKEEKKAEE